MTLIERLEAATGPDRELGNEVLFECGWMLREEGGGPDRATIWIPPSDRFNDEFLDGDQPNPTASIDAAMMLVPEGCQWWIQTYVTKRSEAQIFYDTNNNSWAKNPGFTQEARAAHTIPAITLCIAALRARGVE